MINYFPIVKKILTYAIVLDLQKACDRKNYKLKNYKSFKNNITWIITFYSFRQSAKPLFEQFKILNIRK